MNRDTKLLRVALAANVLFSTASGGTMLILGPTIATELGALPVVLMQAIGAALLGFATLVAFVATKPRPAWALGISILDFGWILGTVPLVFVDGLLTQAGVVAVLSIAAIVGLLAITQLAGIRRLLRDDDGPGEYCYCLSFRVDATPDAMWALVSDLGAIERFAPFVASSNLRDDDHPGEGVVRHCTDSSGAAWSEACEQFDPEARRLEMRFLTDEPDFPYPATVMYGGWHVREHETGSIVEVWWSLTPPFPLGWLVVALMGFQLDRQIAETISRMAQVANGRTLPETPPKIARGFC